MPRFRLRRKRQNLEIVGGNPQEAARSEELPVMVTGRWRFRLIVLPRIPHIVRRHIQYERLARQGQASQLIRLYNRRIAH